MATFRKILTVGIIGASVSVLLGYTPRSSDRQANPPTDLQAYAARSLRSHFPNVALTNQDKKTVRFYDDVIKDRVVMIQFMYTRCDKYCPMVTPNLARVQRELQERAPKQVTMISITVDPTHDTPQVLKEYSGKFHVQAGWQFLTGSKNDIDWIRRELGVYDPDEKKTEHLNVLTIGKERTGQWLAIPALMKPENIVRTVLNLVPKPSSRTAMKFTSNAADRY
jgi:protein SCO1